MLYRFQQFTLDPEKYIFTENGKAVSLEPRVFDVLAYLLKHRDRIVSKEELIETLWGGRVITDSALNTCIRSVRRALSDVREKQSFVRTFPKRGFQFVGQVEYDLPATESIEQESRITTRKSNKFAFYAALVITTILALAMLQLYSPDRNIDLIARPSIAILDFDRNVNSDTQRYFSEGLIEELVSSLSRYRELFVISRNSSTLYSDTDLSFRDIGQELGADYIVDGNVGYKDDNIRISAKLVDARSGQQVWSTQFKRKQGEIYELQSEMAYLIAGQVVPEVIRADTEKNLKKPPEVLDAWALYHKARTVQAVYKKETQDEAIRWATLALERDPNLAAAYGVIARAKGVQFFYQWSEDREQTLEEAIENAKTAISLDKNDAGAYAALGYIYRYTGDETSALANLKAAAQLNPSDANIKLEYAHTLDWFRHQQQGLSVINQAIRLSPRDPRLENMLFYKAHMLFHLLKFEESIETTKQMSGVLTTDTWRVFYHLMRAANQAQLNRKEEALLSVQAALKLNPRLSISAMKIRFEGSKNHPENRRFWLESLQKAGIPD
jgi:TolB-like protein/DNA-binding winged helix-turn-helix (wHTH) protein